MSGHAMPLRVGNVHHNPFAITCFQRIFHQHTVPYIRVRLGMKSYRRICLFLLNETEVTVTSSAFKSSPECFSNRSRIACRTFSLLFKLLPQLVSRARLSRKQAATRDIIQL